MIRLVVFDLDGTLVDSSRDLADAANRLTTSFGGRALAVEEVVGMVGEGVRLLVDRALWAAGATASLDEAVARFRDYYAACQLVHTRPYPGVEATLARLHGRWPLGVITNKPEPSARDVLEGLDLLRWFDRVVGGDGGWPRKPAPDSLLHLAAEAGVRPAEALLVGDSAIDLQTARRAGTGICLARYGFGFAAIGRDLLDGREWVIDHPLDLLGLLDRAPGVAHEAGVGNDPPDRVTGAGRRGSDARAAAPRDVRARR